MSVDESLMLGIDPGSVKCGMAVVDSSGRIITRRIVPTERLTLEIASLVEKYPAVGSIVMGDGTQSRVLRRAVAERFPQLPLHVVDEHGSSERARRKYIADNPARGWQRLLPTGLRTPSEPYDDLVAALLVQEFLIKQEKNLQQQS